ncbi:transposable element Tcb2 transposase [Trichonephila clavipes]|uniref:Transposable element Tcb2 transposase n=1 Tax=Trichonephila clavipes TaxID=2585209 RepID=A0A8X6RH78_TRICX|nr:transposable element Tcb2 transposase [Trichonephila clavipes]
MSPAERQLLALRPFMYCHSHLLTVAAFWSDVHAKGLVCTEWNQVVFNDESRFNLGSDDNRVRVRRPYEERFNPVFTVQWYIAPTTGVILWGAIANDTRSPLILIHGTMAVQRKNGTLIQKGLPPLAYEFGRIRGMFTTTVEPDVYVTRPYHIMHSVIAGQVSQSVCLIQRIIVRSLEERDIEDYLDQLEGVWLSEDGLDDENSDDEYRDANEIRTIMIVIFNYHQE